jgi:hypothetical protein
VKTRNLFYQIATVIVMVALVSSQGAAISNERAQTAISISFTEHTIAGNFASHTVYTTDLNGDGNVDVLGAATQDGIAWWENDGNEHFTQHTISDSFQGAISVYATDLDEDGDMDVLGAAWDVSDITWWENDGSGHFVEHTIADDFTDAGSVYAADVDGDGDIDVLGAARSINTIAWWENDGDEHFVQRTVTDSFESAWPVYATDLDSDGDVDILAGAFYPGEFAWWENDGGEHFAKHTIADNLVGARSVYATDVDKDGDVDVLGAANTADVIAWWENDGSEHFTEHVITDGLGRAECAYAADLDHDGDVDILGAAYRADDITWWENDGTERFTEHTIADNFDGATWVYATDVDGDGDVDVLGTAAMASDIAWFENTGGTPDTVPPAAIDDLTATPGTYPGDIVLSWTAPGDDGDTGAASYYEVREDFRGPILSKSDWDDASGVEGEPTPLAAGTPQTMTVSLTPGHMEHFAIRACDEVDNCAEISNPASDETPGMLISDINWELGRNPAGILDEEVTVLVIPARTDDLTLGIGNIGLVAAMVSLARDVKDGLLKYIFAKRGAGGNAALAALAKASLAFCVGDNLSAMRAQLLWGLHSSESGDPTLLLWDPGVPLLSMGVPYVVTGTVREWESSICQLKWPLDGFYYLEVTDSTDVEKHTPSATDPHLAIPSGYTYHYWHDMLWDPIIGYGDQVCTIGLVTERYPIGGYHYVRIQLLERADEALPVRVSAGEEAPDIGSTALFCGTKRAADGDDLHPGELPLQRYLDTTAGEGGMQVLQGTESEVARHESSLVTQMQVETGSPVDIHVYDPVGNHVGVLYDGNGSAVGVESEIPNVEYFYGVDGAPEIVSISNPTAGAYTVTVRGTATGTYTQTVRIYSSGRQTYTSTVTARSTHAGQEDTTIVDEIPAAPTGLELDVDGSGVNLAWDDNTEDDLGGYNIYRSTRADGGYQRMNEALLLGSSFTDSLADAHTAYYYYVTAVDTDHNESGHLAPVASRYFIYLPLVVRAH